MKWYCLWVGPHSFHCGAYTFRSSTRLLEISLLRDPHASLYLVAFGYGIRLYCRYESLRGRSGKQKRR